MKKFLKLLVVAVLSITTVFGLTACGNDDIIVQTNAFFAPFEYYDGKEIVGVDVDIMNMVGERLDRNVVFKDGDFGIIIDTVSDGKLADVGAAGLTITPDRAEKVDFSIPYYTAVQYVMFLATDAADFPVQTAADGTQYVLWSTLGGKDIGVQTDTTGNIYVEGEINKDDGFAGVPQGTGAEVHPYTDANLAPNAIGQNIDCVVIDELPAKYMTENNDGKFICAALYYDAETATEEQYAICVKKGNDKLLDAINEVLQELIDDVQDGQNGIDRLVAKHFGLED